MMLYLWDEAGHYAGDIDYSDGPLPPRATMVEPPAADAGCRVVWRGAWVQEPIPTPDLDDIKQRLVARATGLRWQHETGGITVGGASVATGISDQNRIVSVLASPTLDSLGTVDFKGADGWVTLTVPQLTGIATAIANHVQACFSAERAHHEAIAALTDIPTALAYDVTTDWPA